MANLPSPPLREFQKIPFDYPDLIGKLRRKGLTIGDSEYAAEQLKRIGYYRFVGYGLPFEEYNSRGQRTGVYASSANFQQIIALYDHDLRLRQVLLAALAEIEIGIRNLINHTLCIRTQKAHWFLDQTLFVESDKFKHSSFLNKIKLATSQSAELGSERQRLRDQFINHYYTNYDSPEFPPGWMIAEVLSLGSWSLLFQHFQESKTRKSISRQLDLSPPTLESWLHSLTYLRNLCAHHGRLAMRHLPLQPAGDKELPRQKEPCLFNYFGVTWYLLKQFSGNTVWLDQIFDIVDEIDNAEGFYGIPNDWLEDEFWFK